MGFNFWDHRRPGKRDGEILANYLNTAMGLEKPAKEKRGRKCKRRSAASSTDAYRLSTVCRLGSAVKPPPEVRLSAEIHYVLSVDHGRASMGKFFVAGDQKSFLARQPGGARLLQSEGGDPSEDHPMLCALRLEAIGRLRDIKPCQGCRRWFFRHRETRRFCGRECAQKHYRKAKGPEYYRLAMKASRARAKEEGLRREAEIKREGRIIMGRRSVA